MLRGAADVDALLPAGGVESREWIAIVPVRVRSDKAVR
jgi:hypothetical protein